MKKYIFLTLILISLLLVGCDKEGAETKDNVSATTGAFIGGTEGVRVEFMENAPPKEVFGKEGTNPLTGFNDFDINIKVENIGEHTIPAANYKVSLSGIDPNSFFLQSTDLTSPEELLKLRKSAGETIPGTFSILEAMNLHYVSPVFGQVGPFNLRANVCYKYETQALSKICLLADLLGKTRKEGLCKATESKAIENSGAPVHVTDFKESVTGSASVAFSFKVVHASKDKNKNTIFGLAQTGTDPLCDLSDLGSMNKVKVEVYRGTSTTAMKCSGIDAITKMATLYGESGANIRCRLDNTVDKTIGTQDLEEPIRIVLTYNYLQYTDQQIIVKEVGT